MRAWWALVVLSGCAHVASTPRAPEQWSDEPPAAVVPVEATPEPPRVGPVVGLHVGGSLGNRGPNLGGRAGARFRVGRHVELSTYVDAQVHETAHWWLCGAPAFCNPQDFTDTSTSVLGVARISIVADGQLGPMFVPRVSVGAFVGGGVGFTSAVGPYEAVAGGLMRAGLHFGMTRLPNDWWFPVFLEASVLGVPGEGHVFTFVFGVGL